MSANEEAWRDAPPPAYAGTPIDRDVALAIGEPLYRVIRVIYRVPFGFLLLLAGWGISVPPLILRATSLPQVVRLLLAAVVFAGWVALIVSQAIG